MIIYFPGILFIKRTLQVLESSDVQERLALALELLAKDKEMARVQQEIIKQVEEKVSKQQREYFLREQLKNIKKVSFLPIASSTIPFLLPFPY